MVAQVIESGKATLLELRERYSLEDLYNMWEVTYTKKYNEWLAQERAKQSERLRGR